VDVQDLKRNVLKVSRNSSVGIATRYGLDGSLFEPRCGGWGGAGRDFTHSSIPTLGTTQLPVQCAAFFSGRAGYGGRNMTTNHPGLASRLKKE